MGRRIHAFGDDVLAGHDGIALAALIRSREVSRREVVEAALARLEQLEPELNAVVRLDPDRALSTTSDPVPGPFSGVPTFVKDNTDLHGLPTGHGSEAVTAKPAGHDAPITKALLDTGLVPLGKSRLPEFGFNAATEFRTGEATRNPWDTDYSPGASSGGAAAMVAAGVVPLAHANDGGGSIRIPAAACGLVGLKPSRGRYAPQPLERILPVNILAEGLVTRSVRDTAHFVAAAERHRSAAGRSGRSAAQRLRRNPALPPVGLVEGPGRRRLRIGLVLDSITGHPTDDETRTAVLDTARLLERLGHTVEELPPPSEPDFIDDFTLYWGLLAFTLSHAGGLLFAGWDPERLDGLTRGLAEDFRRRRRRLPGTIRRLRASREVYAQALGGVDGVLCPVVAHVTPPIGYLSPEQPYEQLIRRLVEHVAFTPLNNAAGSPAIALPTGATATGLPIGVQLMGRHGDERTLLELAYEIEAAAPFRRIDELVEAAVQL